MKKLRIMSLLLTFALMLSLLAFPAAATEDSSEQDPSSASAQEESDAQEASQTDGEDTQEDSGDTQADEEASQDEDADSDDQEASSDTSAPEEDSQEASDAQDGQAEADEDEDGEGDADDGSSSDLAQISQLVKDKEVDAKAALLVNMNTDTVYYEKNAREKVYPASITKVMTALLVLEAVDRGDLTLDTQITAGSETWLNVPSDASTANIQIGETMRLEDLLYCLLLPSANEAANILAQEVSGSVASFVDLMNSKAVELGCTGTHFVNPNGIHDPDHYTTCYDLYLIAKQAMENETFRKIVSTDQYTVPPTNMSQEERTLRNTNGLLTGAYYSGYTMEGCIGIKTGTTDAAGYCLLSAAERDGTTLLSVVMGAETVVDETGTHRKQFSESSSLLNWGFDSYSVHSILDATEPVAEVPVTLGKDVDSVLVVPANSLEALLPNDVTSENFTTQTEVVESAEAPIAKGQVLGTLTVYLGDQSYGSVDLVAVDDVEQSSFLAKKKAVEDLISTVWFKAALGLVIVVLFILVLRLTVFQPKRRYGANYPSRRQVRNYKGSHRRR